MTRTVWRSIIESKAFYIKSYRMLLNVLVFSLLINILLCVAMSYVYLHQPSRAFYATDGVEAPVKLKAFDFPNYSSEPWLPPDPVIPNQTKIIPG